MPSTPSHLVALRGPALTFTDDPFRAAADASVRFESDALLLIEDGIITAFGEYQALRGLVPDGVSITRYDADSLILPGFIDAHVHYPQTQMIAAPGGQLLDWLNRYALPAEEQFADGAHARAVARVFLRELLRCGTTTAAVFCTVFTESVDAFFEESARLNTLMIAGKVLMDRHAPSALLDPGGGGTDASRALIERWHGHGRQLYAITPRFAPTSSPEQMQAAGALWKEYPGTYLQSHVCENRSEMEWVRQLYPERGSYLDVYDYYGQLGPRAIYGHAVWFEERDFHRCHETGTAIAHCPSSNLFLGSGLFKIHEATRPDRPVRVGIGTDVGAGTSFSQLATLADAYKVASVVGQPLTSIQALYLATAGAARALYLDHRIGLLTPGHEGDLVILDLRSTPLIDYRMQYARSLEEQLLVQIVLGDDRAIRATYVAGALVHEREGSRVSGQIGTSRSDFV